MADKDILKWQTDWDKAAAVIAKDYASSFSKDKEEFKSAHVGKKTEETVIFEDEDYKAIFYKTLQIGKKQPVQKLEEKALFGAEPRTKSNPTQAFTAGPDDHNAATGNTRVTPNFSSGQTLDALMDMKKELEILEREHFDAEVKEDSDAGKLKARIAKIREKVEELSGKINSNPYVEKA